MTLMVTNLIGFGARANVLNKTLLEIIQDLSLDTNLELCLDAGDGNSYTSGTKWLDVSGNGYDFFRGATISVATDDPTFNGTAGGLTSAEYWSFDGADFFELDQANPTAFENMHKDNADCTIIAVVDHGSSGAIGRIYGVNGNSHSYVGESWGVNASPGNTYNWSNLKGGAPAAFSYNSTDPVIPTDDTWNFCAVAIDEAGGAGASHGRANANTQTFDGAYTSPSASSAAFPMQIGANGNSGGIFDSNWKMACFAIFSEALSVAQTGSIRDEIMARFA